MKCLRASLAGSTYVMAGGIGIALLLIIAVVVVGFAIALYVTGGALWAKDTSRRPRDDEDGERPEHERPSGPAQEHTHFVGSRRED
jgi:hypothetical protein